ncbi:hypothetical protein RA307_30360 [Xanthobacteraceae bacterium Astr-EGSB]|uniref:hypothetical protein n=1 Tax=Astrobacterium formosum TaxID=3069710 RepID=UPI0027B34660|nr:hypothetical protein [Xanthobacteraceae bacterium Astr-EGSB]
MANAFFVLDGDDNTLYFGREQDDGPQSFASFAAAERRAKKAADCEPGTRFKIVEVKAIVMCPVLPAKTFRR